MATLFDQSAHQCAAEHILPYDDFQLFSDIGGFHIRKETHHSLLSIAEKYSAMEYELLPASVYMQFTRTGNRSVYQQLYFKRRKMVLYFLLGEYIERKGRFLDKLIDGIWLILEESTWVVPAHNRSLPELDCPLTYAYKEKIDFIDLFAAETGALLAFVFYLGADILDPVTPLIRDRILYELKRRILHPYLNHKEQWWMGYHRRKVNNWCPWIASNVLTVCALCEKDTDTRKQIVLRTLDILNHFTSGYHDDGGCDEGPSYWNKAGACYFDCLELLYDMTGGALDLFDHPFVKNLGEYIAKVHIHNRYYVNFADCPAENDLKYDFIVRFGRRIHSEYLENFGIAHQSSEQPSEIQYNLAREIKSLCEPIIPLASSSYHPPKKIWLNGICVMTARNKENSGKGLFFAMKGGYNAESHNHNDIGNFIIYSDGNPFIIDVGVGTYTADTFNENRYKIWTMQSKYHNLPSIGGYDQHEGAKYRATYVRYYPEKNKLSMNLVKAYPQDAGIRSYIRTGELTDEGAVRISDSITLESPAEVIFHLILADKPSLSGKGMIRFENGRIIEYNRELTVELDTIEITDEQISNGWKRKYLYRLCMKAESVVRKKFILTIQ